MEANEMNELLLGIKDKITGLIENLDNFKNDDIKKHLEKIEEIIEEKTKEDIADDLTNNNNPKKTLVTSKPIAEALPAVINLSESGGRDFSAEETAVNSLEASTEDSSAKDENIEDAASELTSNLSENNQPTQAGEIEPNEEAEQASTPTPELSIAADEADQDDQSPVLANLNQDPKDMKPLEERITFFQAKNGKVGEFYSVELTELALPDDIVVQEIQSLDEIELVYNKMEGTISGTPTTAGDYEFTMAYNFDGSDDATPLENKKLRIFINPDPRSLWKELDPPESEMYRKKHFDFVKKTFHDYTIVGGSHRGRSHAHEGTFRDDDFVIAEIDQDIYFVAVADGAGSSKYSREGSKIACDKSLDVFRSELLGKQHPIHEAAINYLNEKDKSLISQVAFELVSKVVHETKEAINTRAEEHGHELKDYATTFLFTLILKLEQKYLIIAYAIGDGIIALIKDEVTLLSNPDGGEFAGQTRFLTMSDALENIETRLKVTFVDDLAGLYLMTDGISDPKFETDANFSKMEKWESFSAEINQIDVNAAEVEAQFKEWISFWSKGNHDDRTIAYITKGN